MINLPIESIDVYDSHEFCTMIIDTLRESVDIVYHNGESLNNAGHLAILGTFYRSDIVTLGKREYVRYTGQGLTVTNYAQRATHESSLTHCHVMTMRLNHGALYHKSDKNSRIWRQLVLPGFEGILGLYNPGEYRATSQDKFNR